MAQHSKNRDITALTALQVLVGAGVAAGAGWLIVTLYGYYAARQSYQAMSETYLQPAESTQAAQTAETPAETVDFAALTADYPEAVAWLKMDDISEVNYPIMQHADNDFYLRHAPDGSYSAVGSIFLDCNNQSTADTHTLIYGHTMRDHSMFGGLDQYKDQSFYQDGTGCFTVYTADGSQRYQIFAVQIVPSDSEIYSVGFAHDEIFAAFLQKITAGSLYDTGVTVTEQDQVITLSTCATFGGTGRLVLSAKAVTEP